MFVTHEAVYLEKGFISRRQSGRNLNLKKFLSHKPRDETEENVSLDSNSMVFPKEPERSGRISY